MKQLFKHILFTLLLGSVQAPLLAQLSTVNLSMPNSFGKRGNTYAYPVECNDSLSVIDSVLAGEFTVSHDGYVIDIIGVDTIGTMLSNTSSVIFNAATNKVAFTRTQPLTGKGVLVYLLIKIKSSASGTSPVNLTRAMLNEGTPAVNVSPGSIRPMDIFINPKYPPQNTVVGDTIPFTVTGDVTLPVTWAVSDTHVASIDTAGKFVGKNPGVTTVTVTDAQGLTDQSTSLPVFPPSLNTLTISVHDTAITQNLVFDLPIYITDVTSLGIVSAEFSLSFNQSILIPQGVINAGSLTSAWSPPVINIQSGKITVAMAGTDTLEGSGVLAFVRFKVQRFASFSTSLTLSDVLFNENITATIDNGFFTPLTGPIITISGIPTGIIRNETALLSASGGTAPYRWKMLSDTNAATIDSITGLLKTKKSGKAVIAAIDVNGFDGFDSTFVHDFRVSIPDTTVKYNDSVEVPVLFSDVSGLDIFSTEFEILYDTAKVKLTSVIQLGTMSSGMAMQYKDSIGKVSLGFSGTVPLSGIGTFTKLRFKSKGLSAANSFTPLDIVKFDANEEGPTYRFAAPVNGSIFIQPPPNTSPVFTDKLRDTTINEGQLLTYQYKAFDADGDPLTFGLVTSSPGMSINNSTGVFTWTPSFTQAGQHKVVVDVGDFKPDGVVRDSAIITVLDANNLPVFAKVMGDTLINENQQLTFDVDANDPDGDVIRYFIESFPVGMSMDSITGVLSWRPNFSQEGIYNIVIVARDSKAGTTKKNVSITVRNVNRAPFFTRTLPDTTVSANVLLQYQFQGNDPDGPPIQFLLVEGPAGAGITTAGLFSWTPAFSQTGTFRIIIGLSDPTVMVRDTAFVTVLSTNTPPQFTSVLNDTIISEGQSLTFMYQAFDAESDPLGWSLVSAPSGVQLNASGELTWTPTFFQSGIHSIIVSVSDGVASVNDTAVVTVANVNRAPFFTSTLPDVTIGIDSPFVFQYTAADPDSEQVTFSFVKSKTGAALTSAGLFSWKPVPADLGADTFIVSVTDGNISVLDTAIITVFGFPYAEVSQMQFDFGSMGIGASKTLSAVIKNSGYIPLEVNSLPSPAANPNFVFDSSLIQIIAPGDSQLFSITFAPVSAGTHGALFTFSTNDPLHSFIGITAQGTSIAKAALKKKILVDTVHNSSVLLADSLVGMTQLFAALKSSGIEVSFTEAALTPAGFDAVAIVAPQENYTPAERAALKQFVADGGLLVLMGNASNETGTNAVLNALLSDTGWNTGMSLMNNLVADSTHHYLQNPNFPIVTQFADTAHPYLRSVDSLVLFNSSSVLVTGSAIPFARFTSPAVEVTGGGTTQAAIGLVKIGKGKLIVFGDASLWQNGMPSQVFESFNIDAEDNFALALNIFSVTEDYEVKMPAPTPNETYQLVSIPFDLGNADIADIVQNNLGGVNPLVWRLFGRYNPATNTYAEFPSDAFNTFRRGEAYWLITRGQFNLNFGSATVLPAQDFFPIKIGPGYSMIGNPFPYKVSWANSIKGDSVQNTLYWFNPEPAIKDFVSETQVLEPFKGYFVKNLSQDSVTIYINPLDVSSLFPKQGSVTSLNENEWRISVGASSGKANDKENFAGVSPLASIELDKLDAAEPPSTPTDYIVVRFNNSSWKKHSGNYAVDIRPVADEGVFWDLDVTTAKKQAKVALSLSSLGNLPSDFIVYLIDKKAERAVLVERNSVYDFTMGKNESRREFRLVAGKKEFVESNTGGIPLAPKEFALGQNFPNPFNPSTTIRYTIGHSGDVSITIYNVLGQKIRTLMNGFHSIGSYDIEWDGTDDHGLGVATGVYFYRITVKSQGEQLFNETKKAVLMK